MSSLERVGRPYKTAVDRFRTKPRRLTIDERYWQGRVNKVFPNTFAKDDSLEAQFRYHCNRLDKMIEHKRE